MTDVYLLLALSFVYFVGWTMGYKGGREVGWIEGVNVGTWRGWRKGYVSEGLPPDIKDRRELDPSDKVK